MNYGLQVQNCRTLLNGCLPEMAVQLLTSIALVNSVCESRRACAEYLARLLLNRSSVRLPARNLSDHLITALLWLLKINSKSSDVTS